MSILSENIKKYRLELKMSQDKLAELVNYSDGATISKIEKGRQDVPYEQIEIFAKALETTAAKLCGFKHNDNENDNKNNFDLQNLAEKLRIKGFQARIFQTKEEAINYIISIAERYPNESIGLGSKIGFEEMGLTNALKKNEIQFSYASENQRNKEEEKKAINSSVFVLSATGIAYETAEIINISANSRSIAGSLSCADEIIFVIGKNKITANLEKAIQRSKSGYIAQIAKTFKQNTPCATDGICKNCNDIDRLCRTTCIYHCPPQGLTNKVILIDEIIGY